MPGLACGQSLTMRCATDPPAVEKPEEPASPAPPANEEDEQVASPAHPAEPPANVDSGADAGMAAPAEDRSESLPREPAVEDPAPIPATEVAMETAASPATEQPEAAGVEQPPETPFEEPEGPVVAPAMWSGM
jgi:hypothetical protein